jgi:hypothetical protein
MREEHGHTYVGKGPSQNHIGPDRLILVLDPRLVVHFIAVLRGLGLQKLPSIAVGFVDVLLVRRQRNVNFAVGRLYDT